MSAEIRRLLDNLRDAATLAHDHGESWTRIQVVPEWIRSATGAREWPTWADVYAALLTVPAEPDDAR